MSTATDTVDVTDLVEKTRSAFVSWAVSYLFTLTLAIPHAGPIFALPVVSWITKSVYEVIIGTLSKSSVMMAFFMNTVLRKATQADDFIKAADALANLPQDVSDEDYAKAEAAKMQAFNNFVVLTN